MTFAVLCSLFAIVQSGARRPDGAVPRIRARSSFEPGANPLSAAERPAAARGLEAAAKAGSPLADPFASASAPASGASASGAKVLRGSLGREAQSQGKFAQSSVPAPRRAASKAKASGVDVAAPRSEDEDSADDDAFERKRERAHPSAPALLVREGSLGGGGRQLEDTADVPACLEDCDNDCYVFLAGRCGLSCTEDEAMWAEESCGGSSTDDDSAASTAAPTAALCVLRNTTVCWGNEHHYVKRTSISNPFDGIDVGDRSAPALADLDDDGDLDLVVGEWDGVLNYYENVGNATWRIFHRRDLVVSPGHVLVERGVRVRRVRSRVIHLSLIHI